MATDRRTVRVSPVFFDDLDRQLGSDRGEHGEPSATDFLVIDLPTFVERFATDFDALPEVVEGVPAARLLVATGRLVHAAALYGVLAPDGSIDLVGVELDL
ncbi:MAG: hypothetical protein ACT4PX_09760 [Actinomycetota bacterium]